MRDFYQVKKEITVIAHVGEHIESVIRKVCILALQEDATVTFSFNGTVVKVEAADLMRPYLAAWQTARNTPDQEG